MDKPKLELKNKYFNLKFDNRGITSLKKDCDKFDTDYIRDKMNLGNVKIAYRKNKGPWIATSTNQAAPKAACQITSSSCKNTFVINDDLKVLVSYKLNGKKLSWDIKFSNLTNDDIQIGDIGLPFPCNTIYTWDKETTLNHRVLRHSHVAGHGSFMFWLRCNTLGPYLLLQPKKNTKLEYFDLIGKDQNNQDYTAFINSSVRSAQTRAQGGNWRQTSTCTDLAPKASTEYGFNFYWADSYDDIRESLFQNDGFDINIVPGMVVPNDLSAQFSLRTKNSIDQVMAEFPQDTKIEALPSKEPNLHIYKVTFARLGENQITIKYNQDQSTYLEFFVTEPVETLIKKRASFLVDTHQINDAKKWYNGLYGDWNMDNHVLLTPDSTDRIIGWREYMISCDDPGLGKAPLLAMKNMNYPNPKEIASLESYIDNFVWGGLQQTTDEKFPYAIYGIPDWNKNRNSKDVGPGGLLHIWRIYDYPHITLLYYTMYKIAKFYPELNLSHSPEEYLRRAYGTARAFFTIPLEIREWSAYKTGTYNELIINSLINELKACGWQEEEKILRIHWERKISSFVGDDVNPFGSEYAFDSTGFESTHAFAKYAIEHAVPDQEEIADRFKSFKIKQSAAHKYMEMQIDYNLFCRGWLETSYYHYGSDYLGESSSYTLRYMSQMGGWSILDYGLYYAKNPFAYLRLGYGSYLSSWALMNTGTKDSNYGYWYPGPENDGGAGGGFEPQSFAKNWLDQEMPRGSWAHSCEIDLGFSGGLRMAATVVADDPIFGLIAMGGDLNLCNKGFKVMPKDGLNRRFHYISDANRLHMILRRDGFSAKAGIFVAKDLKSISFEIESRWAYYHESKLDITGLIAGKYMIVVDGTALKFFDAQEGQSYSFMLPLGAENKTRKIEIIERK